MKQLFKTFTMLLFVSVLFTNKLNAQVTLEHTFEKVAPRVTIFGNCLYTTINSDESITFTIYNQDYSIYKNFTIPYYGVGYEVACMISPELCYIYWYDDDLISTGILYDTDCNIIKVKEGWLFYNDFVLNNNLIFFQNKYEDTYEIYSIDGYESVKNVRATSFGHAYPNPARNTISLPYNLNKGEQAEMLIYDVNGKMIEKKTIDSTFDKILLNVESYTPGIYFYSVNGISHKFVVR